MNEQLDKYFLGELSDTEKKDLFDQIESSPEKKAEFIRMQNTVTISKLGEQNGDDKWASLKIEELGSRINRKQARRLYSIFSFSSLFCKLSSDSFLLSINV